AAAFGRAAAAGPVTLRSALFAIAFAACAPAQAQPDPGDYETINRYRSAPHSCAGKARGALAPLEVRPELEAVARELAAGASLGEAMRRQGYRASRTTMH